VVGLPLAVMEGTRVPQPGEHVVPLWVTAQVLPLLSGSLTTVAVNCWVILTGISALPGAIAIVMDGTVTVTMADAVAGAADVAVMFTDKSLVGGVEGAV